MHIRPALEADKDAVQALYDGVPYLVPRAPRLIADGHIHVAEADNGNVHGFFMRLPSGFVWVIVAPEHRRAGIGRTLLEAALKQASEAGETELTSQVEDANAAGNAFCAHFNFQPFLHFVDLSLDLTHWDESLLTPALEQAQAAGIRFMTFAELGNTAENRQRIYTLNKTLSATIPREQPQEFASFETYVERRLSGQTLPHEGISIALDGDEWVGMTQISLEEGYAFNHMTGVLPHYRRRGIAQALKLLGIGFARRNRTIIRTFNDVTNPAMIAVNVKAGFCPVERFRRFRRKPLVEAP